MRRLQVGMRDDISTSKRAQSTFRLTSGEADGGIASVQGKGLAPDLARMEREARRRDRIELAGFNRQTMTIEEMTP